MFNKTKSIHYQKLNNKGGDIETMRVGIGVKQKSVCAGCDHSLSNHIITASRKSKIVNGKCNLCECVGTLSIE